MDGIQPVAQPGADPRAELARAALIPIVPNAGPRCPRCGMRLLTPDSKSCSRCLVDPSSPEAAARLVPEGRFWSEIFLGAGYVPRGFFKILTTPRLWGVSALPFILNVVIFALTWWFGFWVIDHTLGPLASTQSLENWTGWWNIPAYIIKFIAYIATARVTKYLVLPLIIAWLMAAFPFSILLRAIFMPLSTVVGERAEQLILDLPQAKNKFDIAEITSAITISIVDTLLLALVQVVLYIILLPIALIPPVWMVLPPAIMSGMDHSDPTFCRKNYYMRERVALWKARKWRFLGFGVTFFFLLGIPFVNAVIFPAVAVGAVLLYLELDRK